MIFGLLINLLWRILFTLGGFAVIFSAGYALTAQAYDKIKNGNDITPFLWKIETDSNTVYFLGSIHALREDDHPMPDLMEQAYEDSDAIFVENNVDEDSLTKMIQASNMAQLQTGTKLAGLLRPDQWERLYDAGIEHGFNLNAINNLEPWAASMNLSSRKVNKPNFAKKKYGVDQYYVDKAIEDGKKIYELESVQVSMMTLDHLPYDQQLIMLEHSIRMLESPSVFETLVEAWKTGDEQTLLDVVQKSPSFNGLIYDRFLVGRNKNWMSKITPIIGSDQNYLVIGGAGHFVGPGSVIELLEERGYKPVRVQ